MTKTLQWKVKGFLRHPISSGLLVLGIAAIFSVGVGWWKSDTQARRGAEIGAIEVTNTAISQGEFLIDFFDFALPSTASGDNIRQALREKEYPFDVSDDDLRSIGVVVSYDVTFHGLMDEECLVEWSVYSAESGQLLPDLHLRDRPAFPYHTITPESMDESISERIWIVQPPRRGPFTLQIEIYDDADVDGRVRLAEAETEPFDRYMPSSPVNRMFPVIGAVAPRAVVRGGYKV